MATQQTSYSVKEIAARNSVSESYVGKHIRRGLLKAFRIGGVGPLRVTPADEALWLRGQRQPGDPEAVGVTPEKAASHSLRRLGK